MLGDDQRHRAVVDETVVGAGGDKEKIARARGEGRRRRAPDLIRSAQNELPGSRGDVNRRRAPGVGREIARRAGIKPRRRGGELVASTERRPESASHALSPDAYPRPSGGAEGHAGRLPWPGQPANPL